MISSIPIIRRPFESTVPFANKNFFSLFYCGLRKCVCAVLAVVLSASNQVAESSDEWVTSADITLETIDVGTPTTIGVEPSEIRLTSHRSTMQLVVTGHYDDQRVQDLTRATSFESSDTTVVSVEGSRIIPVGDGTTELMVSAGGQVVKVPVQVSGFEDPHPYSFHYETMPALTKNGCNAGACHGSPSGKGGFRLSLLAYDAQLDQLTLIREASGRRTNVVDPDSSLMLLKPTMQVAHGGGLRMRRQDPTYAALRNWIGEGCHVDSQDQDSVHCVKLEVLPASGRVLKWPAFGQQLVALAHFSDDTIRDVTDLAKFSSSDEAIASVTTDGLVVGSERGQAAILVRYLENVETVTLTFVRDIEGFVWNDPPENNYIDQHVHQKLRQLQFIPSGMCSDQEFIRRIYLDVIGVLPTVEEVTAFLEDTGEDRRARLVDSLLDRDEYASFWAFRWGDLLKLNKKKITDEGMHKYYRWLVEVFEKNVPVDEFSRELLTADGSTFSNPPANYYRTSVGMNECVETTAQLFMGVRIQCAKCHNHPFERWTQDDYYGMAAFFNRIQQKESTRSGELVVWTKHSGEVTQPRTGQSMKPTLPRAGPIEEKERYDRRVVFAEWLTSPDNPFFAKVAVNRIWAHVMGLGIVEPVDDFRDSNPPTNTELLDALADDFRESGFDQKYILRRILNSRTYQLSSQANSFNASDDKLFSHARVRLLSAEQLLDAICHVTDVPEAFDGLPSGTLATHLPGPVENHEFLKAFGQPERDTACACERSNESNLTQALQLFNGSMIHNKLKHENNRFRKMISEEKTDQEIITQLYVAALSRQPDEQELLSSTEYIAKKEDRVTALEDVCWALLNTNEFLFQH